MPNGHKYTVELSLVSKSKSLGRVRRAQFICLHSLSAAAPRTLNIQPTSRRWKMGNVLCGGHIHALAAKLNCNLFALMSFLFACAFASKAQFCGAEFAIARMFGWGAKLSKCLVLF